MVTVTALTQDTAPPRVLITIDDLGPTPGVLTLSRIVVGTRAQVRGAVNLTPTDDSVLIVDNEAPFGVPVSYELVQTLGDGTTVVVASNTVQLYAALSWLSNPITGEGAPVTIATWPDLTYSARQSVLDVAGRVSPVVVSDLRTSASSELVVFTQTRAVLMMLRELLSSGDIILLRPVCDAVEGDYFAVGDVTETRMDPSDGSSWRRLVTLDLQAVDQPSPAIPAIGDTLADLHAFIPGTLADLHEAFPDPDTLLTIARTRLQAVG